MSGSEQSSQEGFDFESAISSGSVSEGSSDGSLILMVYSLNQVGAPQRLPVMNLKSDFPILHG